MAKFIVRASDPGNAVPARDLPILEAGNRAYPRGEYETDFETVKGERSAYTLQHIIRNAPLIDQMLRDGYARYACAVSSPKSAYRKIFVSEQSIQKIQWDEDDLGEPPLFTPMILCFKPIGVILSSECDGVSELWDNVDIQFKKGHRLAVGKVAARNTDFFNLLYFREDESICKGSFRVTTSTQPFMFIVRMHPDLHEYMRSVNIKREGELRENIMTHVITACFARLQRNYKADGDDDDSWKAHRELEGLAGQLESRGQPHWTEESFSPERVATALYPHTFDPGLKDEDES